MKEFSSQEGGRHIYNSDFKNLQELALAMQEIFRDAGGNFVISGCEVTISGNTASVAEGYVYISNKVRKVEAASSISTSGLCIIPQQKESEAIPYADGGSDEQYIDYYAEVSNSSSTSGAIIYDSSLGSFPNLASAWFNNYSVSKTMSGQSIADLSLTNSLSVSGTLSASNGVTIDSGTSVTKSGSTLQLKINGFIYTFSANGVISIANSSGTTLFTFGNGSGYGTVTFKNLDVTRIDTGALYINGVDISKQFAPFGIVQMWAGKVSSIPDGYHLCDGSELSTTTYADLYAVLGTTFGGSSGKFKLPDLRSKFIVGYNPSESDYNAMAKTGGEKQHYLSTSEMPLHSHQFDDYYFLEDSAWFNSTEKNKSVYGNKILISSTRSKVGSGSTDTNNDTMLFYTHSTYGEGTGDAHENRPPYFTLAYIMRIK